jgi:hypothetical protein
MSQGCRAPGEERRIATRYDIRVPVEYVRDPVESGYSTLIGRGTTWDVSLSGVRLSQPTLPIVVGSGVIISFSFFPGSFDTWFPAEVTRHTKDGFAIRFVHLEKRQHEILRRALPSAGNPPPDSE